MIKENVLEIKKLVDDLHCMGTYGMVELELTKIEKYVKELESKVKKLPIQRVSVSDLLTKLLENNMCSVAGDELIEEYMTSLSER